MTLPVTECFTLVVFLISLCPGRARAVNLRFYSYNVVALPLAAGALKPLLGIGVTPALAALFMASSSSLVVLSSLGLKLYTRPGEPTARELAVRERIPRLDCASCPLSKASSLSLRNVCNRCCRLSRC